MTAPRTCLFVATALVLAACGRGSGGGPSDAQISAARRAVPAGAKVFALYCSSCHGEHGDAPMAPAVLGEGALNRPELESVGGLHQYLKRSMPPGDAAGSLSDEQYRAVAEYMRRVQSTRR